jgi:hypothetical protein
MRTIAWAIVPSIIYVDEEWPLSTSQQTIITVLRTIEAPST